LCTSKSQHLRKTIDIDNYAIKHINIAVLLRWQHHLFSEKYISAVLVFFFFGFFGITIMKENLLYKATHYKMGTCWKVYLGWDKQKTLKKTENENQET